MNKQEAIDKLKKESWEYYDSTTPVIETKTVIEIINQIYEPKKPVVPQFVADWYEEYKGYFEYNLHSLCVDFHERKLQGDLHEWFNCLSNKPIETLVMMHKFGYEIEKEKRYTAKLKLTNEYLCYESQFKDLLHYKVPDSSAKEVKSYHFTEYDLVKYHVWGNNDYEVIEVI